MPDFLRAERKPGKKKSLARALVSWREDRGTRWNRREALLDEGFDMRPQRGVAFAFHVSVGEVPI